MGKWCPPFYGNKPSTFYEKKKAKAIAEIKKQETIIVECDKHIVKDENQVNSNKA